MWNSVAQVVADAAGQLQRAAGDRFEFAHGGDLVMVVPATSFTAAALNRRERRARVLNAGSPLHASLAAVPGSCRSGFSRELFSRDGHSKKLAAEAAPTGRPEEQTSELQSLMRISYAVFCLIKK